MIKQNNKVERRNDLNSNSSGLSLFDYPAVS
jgi:hypothetical protein